MWGRRILSVLALGLALLLRDRAQQGYATLSTLPWMDIYAAPFSPSQFQSDLTRNLLAWVPGCLFSSLLLLMAARFWGGSSPFSSRIFRWLGPAWVCPLLAFFFSLALRHCALHHFAAVTDEQGMLFQARVFLAGQWTAPAPPGHEHFSQPALTVYQGRWSYVGAPGWPMLLAISLAVGLQPLIQPLLGALCVWLMQRLSRRWGGHEAATWTGILALSSPALMLTAASGFSHLASLSWGLLALNCLENVTARDLKWSLLSGLCLGAMVSTRTVDGSLLVLVLFVWRVMIAFTPYRRPGWLQVLVLAVGLSLGSLPFLWQNLALSGHPLRTGYAVHGVVSGYLGVPFPVRLHLAMLAVFRLAFWSSPLWLEWTLWGCWKRDRRLQVLVTYLGLSSIAYAHPDMVGFGSRFLLPAQAMTMILGGAWMAQLGQWLRRNGAGLLPFYLAMVSLAVFPRMVSAGKGMYSHWYAWNRWVNQTIGDQGLGILRFDPHHLGMSFCINRPDLTGPLRALSLGPERDAELVAHWPGRRALYLDFNPANGQLEVSPFDRSKDDFTRLCGGAHWANEAENAEQALQVWAQIPDSSPWKQAALSNSERLLRKRGRHQEADQIRARLSQIQP